MELYEESKWINVEDAPINIEELFEQTRFLDMDDLDGIIRFVKYPTNMPIAFGEFLFDGGLDIRSSVSAKINLKNKSYVSCYAVGVSFYEKVNKDEKAYILYETADGDNHEFILIEID